MLQLRLTLVGGIRARKQRGKRLKVQVECCHTEEGPQVAVMMYVVHVAVHMHSCMCTVKMFQINKPPGDS